LLGVIIIFGGETKKIGVEKVQKRGIWRYAGGWFLYWRAAGLSRLGTKKVRRISGKNRVNFSRGRRKSPEVRRVCASAWRFAYIFRARGRAFLAVNPWKLEVWNRIIYDYSDQLLVFAATFGQFFFEILDFYLKSGILFLSK